MRMLFGKALWYAGALALATLSAGCTRVLPYERAKLAHPMMVGGPIAGPGEEHMYSVQEGAAGGGGAAESGCGCN
jgi:hypothetical protein